MSYNYFPFSAIVGQETMKTALLLNVINPSIGGVLIQGEKGTAKTTTVRGLSAIMSEGTRVVELPVGASEDRVVGTINIKKIIQDGEKQFEPGILKEADGNILYVDEINLLEDHIVDVLLDSAAAGINRVERDGISFSHSARFVLVGTMNPEEGTLRPQLLDRFGLCVSIESSLSPKERAEVIKRRLSYERDPESFVLSYAEQEAALSSQLLKAREFYSRVTTDDDIIEFCSGICAKMQVDGYRADITIMKTAGAIAALNNRSEVTENDVLEAAKLALPHRMKRRPFEENELTDDMIRDAADQLKNDPEENLSDDSKKKTEDLGEDSGLPMLEAAVANYQARRIALKNPEQRNAQGGKRVTTKQNAVRGRCIGSARDEFSQKVHVLDSVKSQALSGEDFTQGIADENIRYQTFVRRAGTLIVFLVDSSGSMLAQKRIEMAKGCVMSLLKDAYVNRDKVAMITFGGKDAQVVLPPTASQEQASQMLKKIKTGGKTPMIDAFNKAAILTDKIVDMPVLYVIVSDGRYSRMDCANPETKIKNFGVFCQTKNGKILVVDAEEKSIFALCTAKKLADKLQATYVKIDDMRDDVLLNAVGRTLYVS